MGVQSVGVKRRRHVEKDWHWRNGDVIIISTSCTHTHISSSCRRGHQEPQRRIHNPFSSSLCLSNPRDLSE